MRFFFFSSEYFRLDSIVDYMISNWSYDLLSILFRPLVILKLEV